MRTAEYVFTVAVFALYFGVIVGVALIVLFGRRLATEQGMHHRSPLYVPWRRWRRRAGAAYRAARYWAAYWWFRAALRARYWWRQLAETQSPIPITAPELVHGLAGVQ